MQTGLWVLECRWIVHRHGIWSLCLGCAIKESRRRRKRGKRAGVLIRLRRRAFRHPLPTILLANVQSLDNKLCELRTRISYQRETRDCCVICLTETWMSAMVPDSAIELTGFSVHRSDRMEELTGKSRGRGVCFYINNLWCDERNIHSIKSFCSPDLEFHTLLCRQFWLPREFTAIIITAVYIPPQANTNQALKELYRNISEQEITHPDAAFIITGDFNKANFRTIAPKYFQHVTINTRGDRTLDHCYSPFRDAYKSLPRPPFGKSFTLPFCSCLLIGRNWNVKHPPSGQFNAGRTNRTQHFRTVLITWTGTCSGQRLMTT